MTDAPRLPPVAPREPKDVTVHGDHRVDEYFWMRDRADPRVVEHLKAENAWADAWFEPHAALEETLYREMRSRIREDDDSVPMRKGEWWYSTRTLAGEQYARHLRRRASGADRRYDEGGVDEILLDLNELARGHAYLRLGAFAVSPDAQRLAYTVDLTGGRDYTLKVKDLDSGAHEPWSMPEVASVAWAADGRTVFYVTMDESKRASKLWRHRLDSSPAEGVADTLVLDEPDELCSLSVGRTLDGCYLLVSSDSMDSSEVRAIDAARAAEPNFDPQAMRVVFARRADIEYDVEHRHGRFYVRINDTGRNFRLVAVDAIAPDLEQADEIVAARDLVMIDDLDVFAGHLVVTERASSGSRLRVFDLRTGSDHSVAFDEAAYSVRTGGNAEFETGTLRFVYTSMTTPVSTYDYDLQTRERTLKKRQPVPGYEASLYASERTAALAADGTSIPISLVYRKDTRRRGPQPLLLYGYGSYGIPIDATFSQTRVSLLDRGVVFAIAHVRGGGDLGRTWYEAGKMARKETTFHDFVACAEALIAQGWTAPACLAIEGGSAGGLLMGAVVNARPELFRVVVAKVPFVDVVNTMLDETLPLTAGEFIEWGNPKIAEQYAWIRAYSPYDNLKSGHYPAMLVRSGLNDTQVAYWEPSKYVARLRTLKTDDTPLLYKIDLEVGHGGASGRFDALREIAEDQAFLLVELGVAT